MSLSLGPISNIMWKSTYYAAVDDDVLYCCVITEQTQLPQ